MITLLVYPTAANFSKVSEKQAVSDSIIKKTTKIMTKCELCDSPAGELLHENDALRVILVDEPGYPGFCRVIWRNHVKEMTDLSREDAALLFDWVLRTERALRKVMSPDKINLATLGNMVPHLHWHVIPRFADDPHFPAPIWAEARRSPTEKTFPDLARRLRDALMEP